MNTTDYLNAFSKSLEARKIKRGAVVYVGLSGGVDSSVSALLLKELGFDVRGVFIHCWKGKSTDECVADQDEKDAVKVAAQLKIPIEVIDLTKEYDEYVMQYFWNEYQKGRVPNADILCNTYIKFGVFADYVFKNGGKYLATGHYARVININGKDLLATPRDKGKDQTYFLYQIKDDVLTKTIFPLEGLLKSEVREIALKNRLHNANKKDSQGICFIGNVNIKNFLSKHVRKKKGPVLDVSGNVIGEHIGCNYYTIGQRHGFKIFKYTPEPLYVIDKFCNDNAIVVGSRDLAFYDEFLVEVIKMISKHDYSSIVKNLDSSTNQSGYGNLGVRIRNLGNIYECSLSDNFKIISDINIVDSDAKSNLDEFELSKMVAVKTSENIFGVTPGQHAVFYKNLKRHKFIDNYGSYDNKKGMYIILGGGIISFVNTAIKKRFIA